MRHPQPIPGLPSGALATVRSLRSAGVARSRLSRSDVDRPLRGVVRLGAGLPQPDFTVRVSALRLLLRDGQFISRRTAAMLLGVPLRGGEEVLDVGAIRPTRPPTRPEIRGHQLGDGVLLSVPTDQSRLPNPADVWALLGAVASLEELVIAGDYLVSGASRWDEPLVSFGELEHAVTRFAGCAGVVGLTRALPLIRTGVESPAETVTRLLIARAGLAEPQTHCPVRVDGRTLYADLGYPQWRIAIEYEGAYHFESGVDQARRDNERFEAMRAAGWRVLRVTALDLRDPRAFLARLAKAIAEATSR